MKSLDELSARDFANLLPGLVSYVDRDLRYRFNNAAYARLTGRSAEELIGTRVADLLGAGFAAVEPYFQDALRGEAKAFHHELDFGAGPTHISVQLIPDRGDDDAVAGFYCVIRDETEQVRSRRDLVNRERRLSLVFDAAPFGIVLTDPTGIVLAENRAFRAILGYGIADLTGSNVFDLVHSDDRPRIDGDVRRLHAGEVNVIHTEARCIHATGVTVWCSGGLSVERDEDGGINHMVAVVHDVSDRRRFTSQMQAQLSEQQRHLGQELHDSVGQPLTAVSMLAKSLRSRLESQALPEAATADTLVQLSSAAHAKVHALIRGVRPVEVDREGLRAALDELAASTQQLHDVWCTVECDESVDVSDTNTATQLFRIAQEAVANGVKHGKARRMVLWLGHIDDRVVLRIHDDGVGLGNSDVAGTGMGTRIMRHRATAVGATLAIEDDEGTLVTVTLSDER